MVESIVYYCSVEGDLLKDIVIYCVVEKYGFEEFKKFVFWKQGFCKCFFLDYVGLND